MLAHYFDYSMREGELHGRLVVWPDAPIAAAVWQLPMDAAQILCACAAKAEFLADTLGAAGADTYRRIIGFMEPRAAAVVEPSAWYLSIVGVAPAAQGQGTGARLIGPTLAQADRAGASCYLETFDERNPRFYHRLGFRVVATHTEPLTGSPYSIMIRHPA